jgi:hypothetical protein
MESMTMSWKFYIELNVDKDELKRTLLALGAKRVLFGDERKINGVKMVECSARFYETDEKKIMDFLRSKDGVHFFNF